MNTSGKLLIMAICWKTLHKCNFTCLQDEKFLGDGTVACSAPTVMRSNQIWINQCYAPNFTICQYKQLHVCLSEGGFSLWFSILNEGTATLKIQFFPPFCISHTQRVQSTHPDVNATFWFPRELISAGSSLLWDTPICVGTQPVAIHIPGDNSMGKPIAMSLG